MLLRGFRGHRKSEVDERRMRRWRLKITKQILRLNAWRLISIRMRRRTSWLKSSGRNLEASAKDERRWF